MGTSTFEVRNKKRLDHITMHQDKIWARTDLNKSVFIWKIDDNLDSLEDSEQNGKYRFCYKDKSGWIFTITKTDSCYDIEIDTALSAYCGEMTLRVNFGENLYSTPINVTRRPNFVYKVKVPIEVVRTPKSKFVSFDFIFHESSNLLCVTNDKPLAELRRSSKEMPPFKDLLKSSRFLNCADFKIQVTHPKCPKCNRSPADPNCTACNRSSKAPNCPVCNRSLTDPYCPACSRSSYCAHRSILAARSHIFQEEIRKSFSDKTTEPFHVEATAAAMRSFLSYIYTGSTPLDLSQLDQRRLKSTLPNKDDYKSLNKLSVAFGVPRTRYRARFYSSKDTQYYVS